MQKSNSTGTVSRVIDFLNVTKARQFYNNIIYIYIYIYILHM